ESFAHGVIPVAMEKIANIGQAEVLVELGIPAARDVEIEAIAGVIEPVDVQAAAARPDLIGHGFQRGQVCFRTAVPTLLHPARPPAESSSRRPRAWGLAESLVAGGDEGNQNAPFDLALCKWLMVTSSVIVARGFGSPIYFLSLCYRKSIASLPGNAGIMAK